MAAVVEFHVRIPNVSAFLILSDLIVSLSRASALELLPDQRSSQESNEVGDSWIRSFFLSFFLPLAMVSIAHAALAVNQGFNPPPVLNAFG